MVGGGGNIADTFGVRDTELNSRRLQKDVRDRLIECYVPRCWLLKGEDNGQMYLDRKMHDGDGGKWVQIRRYLFWVAYDYVPDRRKLTVLCDHQRCQNPAHVTYKGLVVPPKKIAWFIDKGWLSISDARRFYNFELGDEKDEP